MEVTRSFLKKLVIAILFFVLAVFIPAISSTYIKENFANPPIVKDLLWEILPNIPIMWLSELFLLASVLYLIIWALKKDINYIPYAILLYSTFALIRAGIIVLTPLGLPNHYNGLAPIGEESVFRYGAFPSGHLAYPVLTFLITKSNLILIFGFVMSLVILISRGHYSIDLIGSVLLGFFIFVLAEKYVKKYFIKSKKD
mgnify:CR=1 FL=1